MNPISNQQFSDDFHKFILQDSVTRVVNMNYVPKKPFSLDPPKKSDKSKKDLKKQNQQETDK